MDGGGAFGFVLARLLSRIAVFAPPALLIAGCGRACGKEDAAPATATSADAHASSAASVDEAARATKDAGAITGDLLWLTNATVAVSSRVDNPRDIPNQVADRKSDTAWNGKTGDLVGAWIKFRVPGDATVSHVMLSVGYDKKTDKEDLFTANNRISKVRVSRGNTVLRDSVDLDPNNRAPQKIDINAKGGDYKIEVLAVVPGAHAGWKEIAVSEVAVIGTASTVRAKGEGPPTVLVGGLDVVEEPFVEVRGESYEAACERMLENEKQATEKYVELMGKSEEPGEAACSPPSSTASGHGAIVETAHARWKTANVGYGRDHFDGEVLAFRTSKHVSITSVRIDGRALTLNPVTTYKLLSEKWEGDDFLLDVEATTTTSYDGASPEQMGEDAAGVDMGPWIRKETLHTVCNSHRLSCVTTVIR